MHPDLGQSFLNSLVQIAVLETAKFLWSPPTPHFPDLRVRQRSKEAYKLVELQVINWSDEFM